MPVSESSEKRTYVVQSDRCVWGEPGEEIELELTEGQEKSLLQAGTVKRAVVRPSPAVNKRK